MDVSGSLFAYGEQLQRGQIMSPVRLGTLSMFVCLLLGLVFFSSQSSLLAQDNFPTPTTMPGWVPFDQLPLCPTPPPDFTPMPADSSLPATCRADVHMDTDVTALIAQGIDPATLGLGDPRDLDPAAFATPTPAAAADTPNQTNKLYLPMMQAGNSSSQVSSIAPAATVDTPNQMHKLYLPVTNGG